MRFRLAQAEQYPRGLNLPWATPLEHRWYLSERVGRDLPLGEVVPCHVAEVLAKL